MNYLDYIIVGFLLIGFVLGYKDGFIRKIIGLAGFILALLLSFKYSGYIAVKLAPYLGDELQFAKILSGLGIFFITIFLFSIIKRLIHPIDSVNKFLNQLLGGITGTLQMVFFISAVLIVLNLFGIPDEEKKENSLVYYKTYAVIPFSVQLLFGESPDPKEIIRKSLQGEENEKEEPNTESRTDTTAGSKADTTGNDNDE